jgi:hypothetical protein
MSLWHKHAIFEKNSIILVIGILIVVAIGGLVEIVPLFYLKNTIEKVDGMRRYTPLELAGRDIYVREGCYLCHSQMIRPLRDEVERYGHYSIIRSSGARSAPAPISPASAPSIPTTGIATTCAIRARWCPARSCRHTVSSKRPISTIRISTRT